jgi:hypothetical protein
MKITTIAPMRFAIWPFLPLPHHREWHDERAFAASFSLPGRDRSR